MPVDPLGAGVVMERPKAAASAAIFLVATRTWRPGCKCRPTAGSPYGRVEQLWFGEGPGAAERGAVRIEQHLFRLVEQSQSLPDTTIFPRRGQAPLAVRLDLALL